MFYSTIRQGSVGMGPRRSRLEELFHVLSCLKARDSGLATLASITTLAEGLNTTGRRAVQGISRRTA